MPASTDAAPVRFSTWDLPECERLSRWREELGRHIIGVDVEPRASQTPFYAQATLQALAGVRFASCVGSPARLTRTRAIAADGDDAIGLVVNLGAKVIMSQRGREVTLQAGEAVLLLCEEPGVLTHDDVHFYGLAFPRAAFAARSSDLDGATMRAIPQSVQPLRLLVSYLDLIRKHGALAAEVRGSVVSHIQDLAALAVGANRDTKESTLSAAAAARLATALAHIAERFDEPELTVEAVARRQRVSRRYLQQLLEESGMSFTARVNELRLQKAFALLTNEQDGKRRISDIAMEAGFSDVSHFNRLFRARFGDTPSGVRGGGDAGQ